MAAVFDSPSEGFLLCHNPRWHGYAFPMKHVENGISAANAAIKAIAEWSPPLQLAGATATPLDRLVESLHSETAREVTVYDYHVFQIDLSSSFGGSLHPDLRLFTYRQLQDALNVTSSTKAIARSFVEDRRVAVGVLTRAGAAGREYLLVQNPNHGYFFPATRIKTDASADESVLEAARLDLGYDGPLNVITQAPEVPALKHSSRFGPGQRRFHYRLGLLEAPGVDLSAPGNAVEQAANALAAGLNPSPGPYWRWFTEDQLRSGSLVSPSVATVLPTVLQLAEQYYRT